MHGLRPLLGGRARGAHHHPRQSGGGGLREKYPGLAGGHRTPNGEIDITDDRVDRAVHHGDVDDIATMVTACCDRSVGDFCFVEVGVRIDITPACHTMAIPVDVKSVAEDRRVGREGGGEARLMNSSINPFCMACLAASPSRMLPRL